MMSSNSTQVYIKIIEIQILIRDVAHFTGRKYYGNSTRSECIDACLIRRLKLKQRDYINLVDRKYDEVKKNYTVRNECIIHCAMPCKTSFYLLSFFTKQEEKKEDRKECTTNEPGSIQSVSR